MQFNRIACDDPSRVTYWPHWRNSGIVGKEINGFYKVKWNVVYVWPALNLITNQTKAIKDQYPYLITQSVKKERYLKDVTFLKQFKYQ